MDEFIDLIRQDVRVCKTGPWMLPEATLPPSGNEKGEVFVIGVGGSTLRLTKVTISRDSASSEELLSIEIPLEAKTGDLFQWCAKHLLPYLDAQFADGRNQSPKLCVSWSFPLLDGRILSMGKSFDAKWVSKDLLELFNHAFNGKYTIQSATNDGTSSLVAGLHCSQKTIIALTLGTGVNINLLSDEGTLINTEISMLGRSDTTPRIKLPREPWDSFEPIADFQPFEVQVGGLYLGQMVSRATGESVSTLEVWKILEDKTHLFYETADTVVTRASRLVASVILGLLDGLAGRIANTMSFIEIAYTGGVIFEPQFMTRLKSQLDLSSKNRGFQLELKPQKYGSEIGAAIACLAEHSDRLKSTNA